MIQRIKDKLSSHIINIPGFRTNRKIIVFQSDDWGSQRTPDRETLGTLKRKGFEFSNCQYSINDSLENNEDLQLLIETLESFTDRFGNHANFTINNIVCNPDFDRIRNNNFNNYYFEPFPETLNRFPDRNRVMDLYEHGISTGVFNIQFHGREHVHAEHWIHCLKQGEKRIRQVFDEGMFTFYKGEGSNCRNEYLDAMGTYNKEQIGNLKMKIMSGIDIFENIWGHGSVSIIAPCYIWHRSVEKYFKDGGVKLIQSGRCQKEPKFGRKRYHIIRRYTGQKNEHNQFYTIRNATFEPFSRSDIDWVSNCLKEVSTAFTWGKPAIISSHRVNYIGSLNPNNRESNLNLLKELLTKILYTWPNVEFMSTEELYKLMEKN